MTEVRIKDGEAEADYQGTRGRKLCSIPLSVSNRSGHSTCLFTSLL